eukprot:TRINITY_DN4300_c0_g1_i1.p2 TRINITY_DN4300_c0_g1~~TRINITY_DN4300_c0_g1_i1.p2  ORF type:complete len:200 (+),score=63.93 TRINITY_DN4300_c0_g1_i1:248-847(+)
MGVSFCSFVEHCFVTFRVQREAAEARKAIAAQAMQTTTVKEDEANAKTDQQLEEEFSQLDLDDQLSLEQYRKKRLAELLAEQRKKYGEVRELHSYDYMEAVQETDPDYFVVVHIFQPRFSVCMQLNQCLDKLAAAFPSVLFCKIASKEALSTFPDHSLPALLVYKGGELHACHMKVTNDLGFSFSATNVKQLLHADEVL